MTYEGEGDVHPTIADPAAVTAAERDAFLTVGFATVEPLIGGDDLAALREAYDEIIDGRVRARGNRQLGGLIHQVMVPSVEHPAFRDNAALDAGLALARSIFQAHDFAKVYEMLIDKPGGTVHETPWHQDVGYYATPVAPTGSPTTIEDLQIWLALDDVDVDNGCMQYLPRAHGLPSLAHRVAAGDPSDEGRLIEIDESLDTSGAVACPLAAGGCAVHLVGTPHYTGPNMTDRPRRAYIFNIGPLSLAALAQMGQHQSPS